MVQDNENILLEINPVIKMTKTQNQFQDNDRITILNSLIQQPTPSRIIVCGYKVELRWLQSQLVNVHSPIILVINPNESNLAKSLFKVNVDYF